MPKSIGQRSKCKVDKRAKSDHLTKITRLQSSDYAVKFEGDVTDLISDL